MMNENEFLLFDRLEKIKATVNQYGEDNCCISFSGGKDSTVLHYMVDMALPNNHIPRVYANTGIELNMIKNFVTKMSKYDYRIKMIKPSKSIRKTLEEFGYPFKSKEHSQRFMEYKKYGIQQKHIQRYLGLWKRPNDTEETMKRYMCPAKLRYQFTDEFCKNGLDISDECCKKMKEEPIRNWQIENNRLVTITGIMQDEGGRRNTTPCISHKPKGIINFNPLTVITKEFEQWFIYKYNIEICDIYKPPYNLERTGCKGCPFNINLEKDLEMLGKYFPAEREQCEYIWKPVYDEYRRLGYRLKGDENIEGQISLFDILD